MLFWFPKQEVCFRFGRNIQNSNILEFLKHLIFEFKVMYKIIVFKRLINFTVVTLLNFWWKIYFKNTI